MQILCYFRFQKGKHYPWKLEPNVSVKSFICRHNMSETMYPQRSLVNVLSRGIFCESPLNRKTKIFLKYYGKDVRYAVVTVTGRRQKKSRDKMPSESLSRQHKSSRGLADTRPVALTRADTLVMIISLHLIFFSPREMFKIIFFFFAKLNGIGLSG